MDHSDYSSYLIKAIKYRISCLKSEVDLVDQQLPFFGCVPGTKKNDQSVYLLYRNILVTLYDVYMCYLKFFTSVISGVTPLKQVFSIHLAILQKPKCQILLQELFGQQSALTTLIGHEYEVLTRDTEASVDLQLRVISMLFPYEFVVALISNRDFFINMMRIISIYDPQSHSSAVSCLFCYIRGFYSIHGSTILSKFFTPDSPLFFTVAETIISTFNHDTMMDRLWNPLLNFSSYEKCRIVLSRGIHNCGLNEEIMKDLQQPLTLLDDQAIESNLRNYTNLEGVISQDITEKSEILSLHHVVLELRKIPFMSSPSSMLCRLSNAIYWISSAITSFGKPAGADEIFQFFVVTLASSKISCIPSLIAYMEKFIDEGLRETRFPYLISQFRIAMEFIDSRMIPVQPYLVFPFKEPPLRLRHMIQLISDDPVLMKGFKLYSFPTWRPEYKSFFPCIVVFSGNFNDSVQFYKFSIKNAQDSYSVLFPQEIPYMEPIPTIHGIFFCFPAEFIKNRSLIYTNNGDYVKCIDDIEVFSSMIMMSPIRMKEYSLSDFQTVASEMNKKWQFSSNNLPLSVRLVIAEIQRALIELNSVPSNFPVDGVLNEETVDAIRVFISHRRPVFSLTPKIFRFIITSLINENNT